MESHETFKTMRELIKYINSEVEKLKLEFPMLAKSDRKFKEILESYLEIK